MIGVALAHAGSATRSKQGLTKSRRSGPARIFGACLASAVPTIITSRSQRHILGTIFTLTLESISNQLVINGACNLRNNNTKS